MFKSKGEVDAHVRDILSKINNQTERIIRSFAIARIYYNHQEYDTARRYLNAYLSMNRKADAAEALKLMGDILYKQDDLEGALDHYKKSYEASKSKECLIKVCELLRNGYGLTETTQSRDYWYNLQEKELNKTPKLYSSSTSFLNGTLGSPTPSVPSIKPDPNGFYLSPKPFTTSPASIKTPGNVRSSTPKFSNSNGGDSSFSAQHNTSFSSLPLKNSSTSTPYSHSAPKEFVESIKKIVEQNAMLVEQNAMILGIVARLEEDVRELNINAVFSRNNSTNCSNCSAHNKSTFSKSNGFKTPPPSEAPTTAEFVTSTPTTSGPGTSTPATTGPATSTPTPGHVTSSPILESLIAKPAEVKKSPPTTVLTPINDPPAATPTPSPFNFNAFAPTFAPKPSTTTTAPPPPSSIFSFTATTASINPLFSSPSTAPPSLGFGELAKKATEFTFGFGNTTFSNAGAPVFGNAGTPVFGGGSTPRAAQGDADEGEDGGGDEKAEEFEPTCDFKPVIPLPPLVELKKGDEDEDVIFEHRAKLLRFDSEVKEWKERGVGNLKILQHKVHKNRIRIVMWREQVHKLACNHNITEDMTPEHFKENLKTVMWTAYDYSDEEPDTEIFVARFGTEEKCKEFKDQFEKMLNILKGPTSVPAAATVTPKKPEPAPLVETPKLNGPKSPSGASTSGSKTPVASPQGPKTPVTSPQGPASSSPILASLIAKPIEKPISLITATPIDPTPMPSPFNFNAFATKPASPATTTSLFSSASTTPSTTTTTTPSLFSTTTPLFSSTAPSLGFGELAKNATEFTFGFGNTPFSNAGAPVFGNAGAPVFGGGRGGPKTVQQENEADGDGGGGAGGDEKVEEFEPTCEFKPVIPLPPLVDLKKGDEDEDVIFEHRAKLFRFDSDTKEWKERGVGNLKILQHKEHKKRMRIVMWREQVHKLACNHNITDDMSPVDKGAKSIMWTAYDYSDEEPDTEIFVARFGTEEKCKEFKTLFERMLSILKGGSSPSTPQKEEVKGDIERKSPAAPTPPATTSQNAGSVASATPSPPSLFTSPASSTSPTKSTFSATSSTTSSGSSFFTTTPSSTSSLFSTSNLPTPPLFQAPTAPSFALSTAPVVGFGDLAKGVNEFKFGFGMGNNTKAFSNAGAPVFGNFGAPNHDGEEGGEEGGDEKVEEFEPTCDFKPVIPLPPLVELKKGDEDEDVIFEHRAKLLRFDSEVKEWKERGVGNLKILQHKVHKNRIRIVMWREQVHKLACNHNITEDMTPEHFKENLKTVMWTAYDYSDEEPDTEIFVARFGQEEKCKEFKTLFEKMIDVVKGGEGGAQEGGVATTPEVEIVFERPSPAEDLVKKAVSLGLPKNFYSYEEGEPQCSGCIGCDPDSFDFSICSPSSFSTSPETNNGN